MPNIDDLMQEWPENFEELLKEVGLPTADLDCDLATYVDMICGKFPLTLICLSSYPGKSLIQQGFPVSKAKGRCHPKF